MEIIKSGITRLYTIFNSFRRHDYLTRVLMYHAISEEKDKWHLSEYLFKKQILRALDLGWNFISPLDITKSSGKNSLVITFDDGHQSIYSVAYPFLTKLNIPFTVFITTSAVRDGDENYLNVQMLQELAKNPLVYIGSHTSSHPRLTSLAENEVMAELIHSKIYLENLTQTNVTLFSYPNGCYSKNTFRLVEAAGYTRAFTSDFGPIKPTTSLHQIPRIEIWNTDCLANFESKLLGNWDWLRYRNMPRLFS